MSEFSAISENLKAAAQECGPDTQLIGARFRQAAAALDTAHNMAMCISTLLAFSDVKPLNNLAAVYSKQLHKHLVDAGVRMADNPDAEGTQPLPTIQEPIVFGMDMGNLSGPTFQLTVVDNDGTTTHYTLHRND